MANSRLEMLFRKIRNKESNAFDNFILFVITFSSILIGLETSQKLAVEYTVHFKAFDIIVLSIFILEVIFKWRAFEFKIGDYFKDGWNIFDFSIVVLSLLPFILNLSFGAEAILLLRVLRLARIIRIFRFISVLKPLQMLVSTLFRSLPSMGYVALLIMIMFYIYGVIGVFIFGESDPGQFGDLPTAILSLFQIITAEGWAESFYTQVDAGNTLEAAVFFISFIIIGSMIILNLFIGVIVSELESLREIDAKGKDQVDEHGHIVIIGWSDKINFIIEELAEANKTNRNTVIAVMSELETMEMKDHFKANFPKMRRPNFVFRTGSGHEKTDLEMMNIKAATGIIINSGSGDTKDSDSIKTLLKIIGMFGPKDTLPVISLPIHNRNNYEIVQLIAPENVYPVLAEDITARLITQTARQPGLSIVYDDLLSFNGHEIYLKQFPELTGYDFRSAVLNFDDAAIIGIRSEGKVIIKPDFGRIIQNGDEIIGIAGDVQSYSMKKSNLKKENPEPVKSVKIHKHYPENILIIGANSLIYQLICEIHSYMRPGSVITIVWNPQLYEINKNKLQKVEKAKLDFIEADTFSKAGLSTPDYEKYNSIIILNYMDALALEEADSQALITLIYIRNILESRNLRKNVVTQMQSNKNADFIRSSDHEDFVISNRIDSLLLAQYSQNPYLCKIYSELFVAAGSEIYLKPAEEYIEIGQEYSFREVTAACLDQDEMLIGYRIKAYEGQTRLSHGIDINPSKGKRLIFGHGDKVIVVAREQYE